MYSASASVVSIKSKSTTASRVRLSPGLRIPESWRHAIRARLPSRHHTRNTQSTSAQDSQKSALSTRTGGRTLGSLSESDSYRDFGHRVTISRSADPMTTVNAMFKPLPRPPDHMLRPNRQSSYFHLSPNISTLGKAVDTNFLSSLEQQVLQSVQILSEPPMTEANVLVQLGRDAFWMSRRDAGMLHRINNLTEHLTPAAKATLLKDLDLLLKTPYKYPLQQVMRHGVQIIQEEPQIVYRGDNESLIDMYSDVDSNTQHMLPAPLRIRKESHEDSEEQSKLHHNVHPSKIALQTGNDDSQASMNHNDGDIVDNVNRRLREAIDHARGGVSGTIEKHSGTSASNAASKSQDHNPDISEEHTKPKQSGSVARARAGLPASQQGALKQSRSDDDIEGVEDRERAWTEELAAEIAALKQPGSVKNARNKIFENPRQAPKPPISIARPNRGQQNKPTEAPSIPGSVGKARIAAENAQARKTAVDNGADDLTISKQNDSGDAPKHVGSVARARVAAENALRAETTKTSQGPADAQTGMLIPVSSLPALKDSSAGDIIARENLRGDGLGLNEFPERLSSLPLRSVEERKRNFKKGLSPVSGHLKAASVNAIAGLRNWNVTSVAKATRTKYRNKDLYPTDVDDDSPPVSDISSPDLLTGSPLFAPGRATLAGEGQVNAATQGAADGSSPIKPIFDIHQAVTTYDQFRLRGGAISDDDQPPANTVKRRISTLLGKVTPLQDHERPQKVLWWLAGGRTGGVRKVPTAGELRERRKVEEANQEVVGYIGTVFGVRAVRRLPMRAVEEDDEITEKVSGSDKDAGKAAKSARGATVEDELDGEKDLGAK